VLAVMCSAISSLYLRVTDESMVPMMVLIPVPNIIVMISTIARSHILPDLYEMCNPGGEHLGGRPKGCGRLR